jgi:GntR family carbon starvation induced transcriptional regulator
LAVTARPKSETRAGEVLHRMRMDIIGCVLKPGERLRFEALRDRYAVSFSTLREALSRLAAEELVLTEGQRGFVVAPISIADLTDLTNVRALIEREALCRSMANGDDAWEADIIGNYHRMERMQQRLGAQYYLDEAWSSLHAAFHQSLVGACESPSLLQIRQKLFERAYRYRRMSSQFRTRWREKDVEHKTIMDAALARQEERAVGLIDRHIRETTENLIEHAGHLFAPSPSAAVAAAGE